MFTSPIPFQIVVGMKPITLKRCRDAAVTNVFYRVGDQS